MKTIIISGTPGSGKKTLAKKLAKKLGYKVLDVHKIIEENKLGGSYDQKKQCFIIDVKKLNKAIISSIKLLDKVKGLIIPSHLSHYLPKKFVDKCIITKCSLKVLKKRLEKRGYSKTKVRENLDVEIFDICLNEAKEAGHKIIIVDSTKKINLDKIK